MSPPVDAVEETIIRLRAVRKAYEEAIARLVVENASLKKENAQLWEAVTELQAMQMRAVGT